MGDTPLDMVSVAARWVSMSLTAKDLPSQSRLEDWVEESYQAVAPKRLAALLDESLDD